MFSKKLAVFACCLCFLGVNALAKKGVSDKEDDYKGIIRKAREMTLQSDRPGAALILSQAIRQESNKQAEQELKKALEEISTVFYTEKGQKVFEYAKSIFRETTSEPLEKLQEASQLEPTNALVHLWTARLYLKQGKCENALAAVQKALEINAYYSPAILVQAQTEICLQKDEDVLKDNVNLKKINQDYPIYYQLLMAQESFNKKQYSEAEGHIQRAEALDKNFPEIYFWKTHILEKEQKEIKDSAHRYVAICKAMTKSDFLKYEFEPRTCVEYKNFEVEYKNAIEQEESKKDL
jgi:tetratricopeptide (TPR) repeat protein